MAQSEAHPIELVSTYAHASARPDKGERLLRRTSAWIMLLCLLQGQLGAVWDREWHFYVGRDQFWTPPHTLIYSCVTGAGLIALAIVLIDTVRYVKGMAGVDDTSTVPIFKIFHAPLGFVIAGFGALQALVAAPLDNYWHNLYGIDVALWAPFHMMGVTGAMVGNLGMVYIFASEAAIEREAGYPYRRFLGLTWLEWGTLLILAGMINFTLIGFLQFPIATFGLLHIPTYALPIAACGAVVLIGAVRFTHRPGTATLTVLLLAVHTFLEGLFVPWAIRTAVIQQDMSYRVPDLIPSFNVTDALLPLLFIVSAVIIDGVALWRQRHGYSLGGPMRGTWLLGIIITLPQLLIAPCLLVGSWDLPRVFLEQKGVDIPPEFKLQAALIAVPIILAVGAGGALLGANFGDIWRWNKR